MFSNKKVQKKNILFVSHNKQDSTLMLKMFLHAKDYYQKICNPYYRRLTKIFFLEWIFALQRNLPMETVESISEYSYRLYISEKKEKFYTRFLFNILAKIYFIKCYSLLSKYSVNVLYIYDDSSIINKACVVAAHLLKIDVNILYQGHKKSLIYIDSVGTRWSSSIPRKKEFFEDINLNKNFINPNSHKENIILVLLQDNNSPDILDRKSVV